MSIIKDIEEAYPVTLSKRTKIRDVYRLLTDEGRLLCSKSFDIPEPEVDFIARVMTHLAETGFPYGPRIVMSKTQAQWMKRKEKPYMVTNWVQGRSPDFNDRPEWKKTIRTLAAFHRHAEGIVLQDVPAGRDRYAYLQSLIEGYRLTLSEQQELGELGAFTALCDEAIQYLNQPKSVEAMNREASLGAFAHGDFNYPNLVLDRKGSIHLIDFENTSLQARMTDLSHILHRNYSWNGEEMVRWIDYYDRKRPLSSEDRHLLFALLHVPYPIVRAIRLNKKRGTLIEALPDTKSIDKYVKALSSML
ncbi:phosphotransferase [Paenibacillus sp. SI8]|uniref:phosphotransferase n=1 Tax=unclassified Paenibacillus TaxID=185978 RepID=UPI003465F521